MRKRALPQYEKKNRRRPASAEGSLLLMVLLVLVILTGVGLSLVFVTEVEMQMGGTERLLNQTFYASESGIHAALAGLVNQNWDGEEIAFIEGELGSYRGSDRWVGTRITTTNVKIVGSPQLPPMTLANENSREYNTYAVILASTAERVAWPKLLSGEYDAPIYPQGDLREDLVYVQSQRRVDVRYLVSPLRNPPDASRGMELDDDEIDRNEIP